MLLEAAPTLRHDDRFEVGVQLPSLLTKSPVRHRLLRKELLLDLLPVPDREALLSSVESFGEECATCGPEDQGASCEWGNGTYLGSERVRETV